jgi:hypothetical protein
MQVNIGTRGRSVIRGVLCSVPSSLGGLKAGEAFNDVSMVTMEARKVEYGTAQLRRVISRRYRQNIPNSTK